MPQGKNTTKSKPIKAITLTFLSFVLLYLGSDAYMTAKQRLAERSKEKETALVKSVPPIPKVIPPVVNKQPKHAMGIITLTADAYGHFRGKVLINNISMPFLVDTGATKTVIPEEMAKKANLPFGKKVATNTAGGKVFAHQTQIDTFNIQGVQINKLEAQINPHLHEVLIGMNTLKYFNMTLKGPHLTLVSNDEHIVSAAAIESAEQEVKIEKKESVIIKRKVCDNNNVCRTVFSDF